jgi:hypothetical protein
VVTKGLDHQASAARSSARITDETVLKIEPGR